MRSRGPQATGFGAAPLRGLPHVYSNMGWQTAGPEGSIQFKEGAPVNGVGCVVLLLVFVAAVIYPPLLAPSGFVIAGFLLLVIMASAEKRP